MKALVWPFWNADQRRLRAGWRVVFQFVVAVICFIATAMIVGSIYQGETQNPFFMMGGAVVQNCIFTGVIILACIFLDRRRVKDIGLNINARWWLDLLGGLAMGAILMGIIFVIQYQLGMITLKESALSWSQILPYQIGWLVAMTFVGAGEEILSRGYQLKNLTEGFQRLGFLNGFILAAIITSSIFGILHASNDNATVIAVVGIIMAGVMFCVGRICTGSLAAPIGMHITWNYFQGAVFGFPVSGHRMQGSLISIDKTVDSPWTGGEFGPENSFMGLIAMIVSIVIFIYWPKKKTNFKENVLEMVRFRDRRGKSRAPTERVDTPGIFGG